MISVREQAAESLRRAEIRPSKLRVAVFSCLMEHRTHPTAETLFKILAPEHPTLSLATVYNTLNLLSSHDLIRTVTIDRGERRFDADTSFHAHFKCRICGGISDIPLPAEDSLPRPGSAWTVENATLDFYGVCPACAGK